MSYARLSRTVPQTEPLNTRQVKNNAGGFVYALDLWKRLDRFLILGSDGGSYYQSARKMTRENAACVVECWSQDPVKTSAAIVSISAEGRAPRNDAAIFALAIGVSHEDETARRLAFEAVRHVCRIGTHLFQFVDMARALGRGWGRGMKRAVAEWYESRSADDLAYQMVKYRSRENYSHKRLLQTAHPWADAGSAHEALYRWACGKEQTSESIAALPELVCQHLVAMRIVEEGKDAAKAVAGLAKTFRMPWEALPTWANTKPQVWEAMLPSLGSTALLRNLGNMTRIGAIKPLSSVERTVVERIANAERMRKDRIHPFAILQAANVYGSGTGVRGAGSWTFSQPVMKALDMAFYDAFKAVVPTGKRHFLALDVSGSMSTAVIANSAISAREASAVLALVTASVEPQTHIVGFSNRMTPLAIHAGMLLADVVRTISGLPFQTTDCALPMIYAMEKGLEVDAFVVITDNETYAGRIHPVEALRQYRAKTGIDAKLVVIGMTATQFTIADPNDGGTLDVVGFDSAAPAVIADFVRG